MKIFRNEKGKKFKGGGGEELIVRLKIGEGGGEGGVCKKGRDLKKI